MPAAPNFGRGATSASSYSSTGIIYRVIYEDEVLVWSDSAAELEPENEVADQAPREQDCANTLRRC
jgi:hypothetical protein